MSYHISKTLAGDFDDIIERTTAVLSDKGFGIMTEIDVSAALKNKLDVDINRYRILGACNPHFAYKALQNENKIGTMLPCNVVVQVLDSGEIEISAVDPMASMMAIENPALGEIAAEVKGLLEAVVAEI